jgi:1-phosphatidylinositol phosphodiesterase
MVLKTSFPSQLPTLGAARGKLVLVRRFVLDTTVSPFGYDFSNDWADNNASFTIQYLPSETAYIEDLYSITNATDFNNKVEIKLNAVVPNLELAQKDKNSQLFISFVSGAGDILTDGITPVVSLDSESYS